MFPSQKHIQWLLKPLLFALCLLPLIFLMFDLVTGELGANPVETLTHVSGEWALRFLLLTLSMTPLRQAFNKVWLIQFRRMLGLYAFFYAGLHFLIYIGFDHEFDWNAIWEDILERPYVTVGFMALVLMLPLAITSLTVFRRKMGKTWKQLHRLVYPISILAIVHFWWLVKADILEPLIYASVLMVLLGYRMIKHKTYKRLIS